MAMSLTPEILRLSDGHSLTMYVDSVSFSPSLKIIIIAAVASAELKSDGVDYFAKVNGFFTWPPIAV